MLHIPQVIQYNTIHVYADDDHEFWRRKNTHKNKKEKKWLPNQWHSNNENLHYINDDKDDVLKLKWGATEEYNSTIKKRREEDTRREYNGTVEK